MRVFVLKHVLIFLGFTKSQVQLMKSIKGSMAISKGVISSYISWLNAFVGLISALCNPLSVVSLAVFFMTLPKHLQFSNYSLPTRTQGWEHCSGEWCDCHIMNRTEEHIFLEFQHLKKKSFKSLQLNRVKRKGRRRKNRNTYQVNHQAKV